MSAPVTERQASGRSDGWDEANGKGDRGNAAENFVGGPIGIADIPSWEPTCCFTPAITVPDIDPSGAPIRDTDRSFPGRECLRCTALWAAVSGTSVGVTDHSVLTVNTWLPRFPALSVVRDMLLLKAGLGPTGVLSSSARSRWCTRRIGSGAY